MNASNFFSEHRSNIIVAAGALIVAGVIAFIVTHGSRQAPPPPPPPVTMVIIQPPKPPPPPPPLPQPKTITPPKMATPTMKPVTPTPTPPKAPSESHIGTSIHGNGPNAFDLSGTPGGLGFGDGDGGGGGTAMGYYESQMQQQIQEALEANPLTRKFVGTVHLHLSIGADGAVTAVQLDQSTGDPEVDAALTNNVLNTMHFPPPPNGTADTFPMNLTAESPMQ